MSIGPCRILCRLGEGGQIPLTNRMGAMAGFLVMDPPLDTTAAARRTSVSDFAVSTVVFHDYVAEGGLPLMSGM